MVGHIIGNHIPVAGRGFRRGAVGPEFGQRTGVIAAFGDVRGVGETRHGIKRAASAVVGPKAVVALRRGGNVQSHAVVGRQFVTGADYRHHVADECSVTRAAEIRGRTRINPRLGRIRAHQREGADAEPLRSEITLEGALGKSVLVHRVDDSQPLPAININHRKAGAVGASRAIVNARPVGRQRGVDENIPAFVGWIIRVR